MIAGSIRRTGFAGRPLALRRAVLVALERRPWQTSAEIAGCCFSRGGVHARPGWRRCSVSELVSTRRALRHLIAGGKVEVRHHRNRWRVFVLRRDEPLRRRRKPLAGGRR